MDKENKEKNIDNDNETISKALVESLSKNLPEPLADTLEISLDSFIENDLARELPIIKYIRTAYNLVDDIRTWHNIKKLQVFIYEFNRGILKKKKYDEYKQKLSKNSKRVSKELEYVVLIIDRIIELEQSSMLAKLYIAYLENQISWNDFAKYSIIVERFLPGDCLVLKEKTIQVIDEINISDSILRLVALGLLVKKKDNGLFVRRENGNFGITHESLSKSVSRNREYQMTIFGEKFIEIICE